MYILVLCMGSVDDQMIFLCSYLDQCRTLSVSMRNTIKYLKMRITNIPPGMPEEEVMNNVFMYCIKVFVIFRQRKCFVIPWTNF